jgi:hypothetical protein
VYVQNKYLQNYIQSGPARDVFNVFQNTGAQGAPAVKKAPNATGKGAGREMNTVKFWLEPALHTVFNLIRPYGQIK